MTDDCHTMLFLTSTLLIINSLLLFFCNRKCRAAITTGEKP